MPKFFCDYCDVYLTHDSMSVRKSHNTGRNHLRNVTDYYQQIGHEKAQSVIDSITNSYAAEGQPNPMLQQPGGAPGFMPMSLPGMPPPPFGAPPGQGGMMPPGGRGMPFPPFNPGAGPPNMPNNMPFTPPPPQGFPPNFQPQFPPTGFNHNPQQGQYGQHGPPGNPSPGPGPSPGQGPPGGYKPGPPPGVGMNRR